MVLTFALLLQTRPQLMDRRRVLRRLNAHRVHLLLQVRAATSTCVCVCLRVRERDREREREREREKERERERERERETDREREGCENKCVSSARAMCPLPPADSRCRGVRVCICE